MRKSNVTLDLRKKEKEFRNPMINRKKTRGGFSANVYYS